MKQRVSRFVLAVLAAPIAIFLAVIVVSFFELLLQGINPTLNLSTIGIFGVVAALLACPFVLVVGVPLYIFVERMGVQPLVAYIAIGSVTAAVVAMVLGGDPHFVVYAVLCGGVAAAVFRVLLKDDTGENAAHTAT